VGLGQRRDAVGRRWGWVGGRRNASASGSQFASYAWGAANVIFVVGAQKLVGTLSEAHERIYQHSSVDKVLEIHQEMPGRIHIVLIREVVGF